MRAWFSALLADPRGVPDEARVMFVVVLLIYLLLWGLWFAHGNIQRWPSEITPFAGGVGGIAGSFFGLLRLRGEH